MFIVVYYDDRAVFCCFLTVQDTGFFFVEVKSQIKSLLNLGTWTIPFIFGIE